MMTWNQRFRWYRFAQTSLLLFPMFCLLLALALMPLLRRLDGQLGWRAFDFSPDGARSLLGAFTSSMLTFIVFVLSSLLIVLQLASQQLSPRVIVQVLSSRAIKIVLGIFTFSYVCTLAALSRITDVVPQLMVAVAVVSNLSCILLFIYFVQQIGRRMRPTAILKFVAEETQEVIARVYPHSYEPVPPVSVEQPTGDSSVQVIEYQGECGVLLGFGQAEIVRMALRFGVRVELLPQVGSFIAPGDPLFRVRGGKQPLDADALRGCVAVSAERSLNQDPRFGFRILVDIASKALSPGINDPTTAVLALDHIHHLLLIVGRRHLEDRLIRDQAGEIRLAYPTPNWDDYVLLAVSEVRHFGGDSIQVDRRLRAMLDHLLLVLPEPRRPPLLRERELLHRAVERGFADPEDRVHAEIGDYQGIGGSDR